MTLRELRTEKGLTQAGCADYLKIPYRTYCRYEADEEKIRPLKREYMMQKLNEFGYIDEEHGILTLDKIKAECYEVFAEYDVEFAYLFGSYAKGKASESSDIDILISTSVTGMRFFGLIERLRETLGKKIDLLDMAQLSNNPTLVHEILKDGIRIYG